MSAEKYVATLRAIFEADSEVDAMLIADTIADNGKKDLELDEGDTLDVTQVLAISDFRHITPQETIFILKKARNALIRVKFKDCYFMAQELDKIIHYLGFQVDSGSPHASIEAPSYDYGSFLDIAHQVLKMGRDPL